MSDSGAFSQPTPDDIREIKAFVDKQRREAGLDTGMPFDIVVEGVTPGKDPEKTKSILEPLADAGATWWIESMWTVPGGMKAVRKRIAQGPPQIV
jgi:hypothetical protein